MTINTKLLAERSKVSKSLTVFFVVGGVIFLSFLMNNFEVESSPLAYFFTICKWLTMFLFMSIYYTMANEIYLNVMKWVDAQQTESSERMEPEQEIASN